ncbi:DUF3486 family protein [Photobacterium damselae]|uniref:DUF3486 family protein n=1 Tax=Photobacterium damselae TaxID=38293 RepID=UPI000D66780F|nr:DUF3486 family protein [Photobacterium damselae]AWK84486.1 hypothetical protein BST98_20855 [Photobacterium damselae]
MTTAVNRKSKVKLLPEHIRGPMNALIRSGEMMQKDILSEVHRMCEEAGLPDDAKPSKTSFNRYVKQMEDMGARIHQAREVAEVWTTKLGDAPVSEVGKLLQEFVRTMAFETSMHLMEESNKEDGAPIPPKALGQLALVVQRIEQAAMTSHKVEKEIRAAFAAEAAEKAEKIVKQAGITATTAAEIKKQILGIA